MKKKGGMGWKAALILYFGGFLLVIILMIAVAGGSSTPVEPPATEEKAAEYQYIGSELGVPWDIALLVDAYNAGSGDIENNPLESCLEFCILREDVYEIAKQSTEIEEEEESQVNESESPVEETSIETREFLRTNYYAGKEQILKYIQFSGDIETLDVSQLVAKVQQTAKEKGSDTRDYVTCFTVVSDLKSILEKMEFDEESIENMIQLHESRYIELLYNGADGISGDVELPELTVGNVKRADMALVAVSLINHPYSLGGKYPYEGIPDVAIDCSGFVDWVYIQCFGKGVSSGSLPDGVAMSGTALQFYACSEIGESELKVGDLCFLKDPAMMEAGEINHVGIYIGKINGQTAVIHCAGRAYGTPELPTGRVGISINTSGISNNVNNVTGGTFSPSMKGIHFSYFRRPNFRFLDDIEEENNE
ncbi:C40 family peptidase [Anaeromicropila populeti]|uniref:NlpC/P60 family protein n=1 Tax=Anaeromicropila populeti TaxID=37658 RepID=A0A1I6LXG2_9FIRM|nr:NlpC/P60 family protein [Anaeromicropila populeti]SFS08085.1 NlpC/P60 family protein [Anaeromicropila populeti]